ncbi:unnamed protein product, partial [Lampetra fluviatilis]
ICVDPLTQLDVDNDVSVSPRLHQLRCLRLGRPLWEAVTTSPVLAATGSTEVVSVVSEDRTLLAFSPCGRRVCPPLVLTASPAVLTSHAWLTMAVTTTACVSVWDLKSGRVIVDNRSMAPIMHGGESLASGGCTLTPEGRPVVSLSNGRTYCYSSSMHCWTLVCDRFDLLPLGSDLRGCLASQNALHCSGPLAALQTRAHRHRSCSLAQLEAQTAAAMALGSPREYRHWITAYTRYLAQEGMESRLREVCTELIGPIQPSACSTWETHILGVSKRDLLRDLLPLIGSNLRLQRLFMEVQEQMDTVHGK